MLSVRDYRPGDAEALFVVCQEAILDGATDYTPAQRSAWAARFTSAEALALKLAMQQVVVGLSGDQPKGLMTLDGGLLDLAYVAPEARGSGLADLMHAVLLNRATVAGQGDLTVHASHHARRFLARQGWQARAEQEVQIGGETLENCVMELRLSA
ncbi:GNAT family N-acetyltransferase [Alphaproteobacteria bacterium KMM 3653]|uniref:GNAT family N-acetyltransferase n=1 Tax=Harenicola maris TaxID=2841044 RepID=A0AAP2CQV6_9RHOB|nr:GNAT family N-acetyltransferase [Harenicola maris]